jgi:hypothetical protein
VVPKLSFASHAEAASLCGLAGFLTAWVATGPAVQEGETTTRQSLVDAGAVVAFLLLCARVLRDIVLGAALHSCSLPAPGTSAPRDKHAPDAQGSTCCQDHTGASGPPDASNVTYSPFRGSTIVPGGAPLPPTRDVADKLDDTVSVLDFVPKALHAAIRSGAHLNQGNQDITRYVQAALDFVGCNTTNPRVGPIATRSSGSVYFPGGLYFISNLRVNASMKIRGEFLDNTTLMAVPGTTGPMIQDKGDAAKITIQDLMIHGGNEPGVTAGIQLGCFTGQPGGSPWGTYAYLTNIESRNIPKGCGIRLKVNVCTMYNVWTAGTADGILNLDGGVALFAYGCGAAGFTGTGILLQQSDYWSGVEIEAPAQGATPVLCLPVSLSLCLFISLTACACRCSSKGLRRSMAS